MSCHFEIYDGLKNESKFPIDSSTRTLSNRYAKHRLLFEITIESLETRHHKRWVVSFLRNP